MKIYAFMLCVIAPGLFAFSFAGEKTSVAQETKPKKEKVEEVPLKSIYATTGQEEVQRINRNDGEYGTAINEIISHSRSGASNVFLVRGHDLPAAVKATLLVLAGSRPVDTPIGPGDLTGPHDRTKHDSIWMVAYLGTAGSSPPAWDIASVERRNKTVRLTYSKPDRFYSSRNLHVYLAWAPLGKLEPGDYSLELFDGRKREVTLLRRVTVEKLKERQPD
jgi:hypothetical protein